MPTQYRQGDVLLCALRKVPAKSLALPSEGERVVVAEGERSGHAHALAAERARLFRRQQRFVVRIGEGGAALRHEEHAPILLPEGCYEIRRQREYAPRAPRLVGD